MKVLDKMKLLKNFACFREFEPFLLLLDGGRDRLLTWLPNGFAVIRGLGPVPCII